MQFQVIKLHKLALSGNLNDNNHSFFFSSAALWLNAGLHLKVGVPGESEWLSLAVEISLAGSGESGVAVVMPVLPLHVDSDASCGKSSLPSALSSLVFLDA